MAANDDFPRGWSQAADPGANAQALINYPASAGVAWVVTDTDWTVYVNGETIAQQGFVGIYDVTAAVWLAHLGIWTVNNQGGWQLQSGSWSGKYTCPVGHSIDVGYSGGYSGGSEQLTASAYPV